MTSLLSVAGAGPAAQAWEGNGLTMLGKDILLRAPNGTQGLELWSSHWQVMPGH